MFSNRGKNCGLSGEGVMSLHFKILTCNPHSLLSHQTNRLRHYNYGVCFSPYIIIFYVITTMTSVSSQLCQSPTEYRPSTQLNTLRPSLVDTPLSINILGSIQQRSKTTANTITMLIIKTLHAAINPLDSRSSFTLNAT